MYIVKIIVSCVVFCFSPICMGVEKIYVFPLPSNSSKKSVNTYMTNLDTQNVYFQVNCVQILLTRRQMKSFSEN